MRRLLIPTFILSLCFIIAPLVLHADYTPGGGIVPSCGKTVVTTDSNGVSTSTVPNPCNFNSLLQLANSVIRFLLFYIATPLAAMAFCYAGFIMITAGGSSEKVTKAKHIFLNVVIGYVIGLAAWLIINTIVSGLGYSGPTFLS